MIETSIHFNEELIEGNISYDFIIIRENKAKLFTLTNDELITLKKQIEEKI